MTMGSDKWNHIPAVQCAVCSQWLDHNNKDKTPGHKPKGNILASRNCSGSGKKPQRIKGFGPGRNAPRY